MTTSPLPSAGAPPAHHRAAGPAAAAGRRERGATTAGPGASWVALRRSGDLLAEAGASVDRVERFGLCRLAAMTAAWALCLESVDDVARVRADTAWDLLARVRPALAEWALVFEACDRRWAAVCRGGAAPTARETDDLQREAGSFRRLVVALSSRRLPVSHRGSLP